MKNQTLNLFILVMSPLLLFSCGKNNGSLDDFGKATFKALQTLNIEDVKIIAPTRLECDQAGVTENKNWDDQRYLDNVLYEIKSARNNASESGFDLANFTYVKIVVPEGEIKRDGSQEAFNNGWIEITEKEKTYKIELYHCFNVGNGWRQFGSPSWKGLIKTHKDILKDLESDIINIKEFAQVYYKKPASMGGGGGSFNSYIMPSSDFFRYGNYTIDSNTGEQIYLTGVSKEKDEDGKEVILRAYITSTEIIYKK